MTKDRHELQRKCTGLRIRQPPLVCCLCDSISGRWRDCRRPEQTCCRVTPHYDHEKVYYYSTVNPAPLKVIREGCEGSRAKPTLTTEIYQSSSRANGISRYRPCCSVMFCTSNFIGVANSVFGSKRQCTTKES